MPHLPESLDEPVTGRRPGRSSRGASRSSPTHFRDDDDFDPVVRMPKQLVEAPPPPGVEPSVAHRVIALALALGALLGAAGVLAVYALEKPRGAASLPRDHAHGASRPAAIGTALGASLGERGLVGAPTSRGASDAPSLMPQDEAIETVSQPLGRGRALAVALRNLGLEPALAGRVTSALRPLINLRTLRPTDVLRIDRRRDGDRALRRVELWHGDESRFAVTVDGSGPLHARRLELVKTVALVPAAIRVVGSLDESMRAAGVRVEALGPLRSALDALEVPRELAPGDALRVLFAEERLNGDFLRVSHVEALDYEGAAGHHRAYRLALRSDAADFFDASGHTTERGPWFAPVRAARVTAPFDPRRVHPVLRRVMPHLGVDFAAREGDPVYAAADGVVLSIATGGPAGTVLRIAHPSLAIETGYAHLSRVAEGVRPGAAVLARALVAYAGSTGRSSGPHLHFSLKQRGRFVDPMQSYRGRLAVPETLQSDFSTRVARADRVLDALVIDGRPGRAPVAAPASEASGARAAEPTTDETGEL